MNLRRRPALLAAVAALCLLPAAPASAAPAAAAADVTPVPSVDVQRYLGTWRQIADIPQFYEVFCVRDVTATYSLNADGTVKVVNTCGGPFGLPIRVTGGAKVLDPGTNAQLQVSFLSFFGQQIYDDGGPNYVIAGLAPDYSWAVVASPDRSSGYVLSRTATLTAAQRSAATAVLVANGYDPCDLTVTRQTGGAAEPVPFC